MIDLMTSGMPAAPTPPVTTERRDEGGPAFAVVLAQALVGPVRYPLPPSDTTLDRVPVLPVAMPPPEPAAAATGRLVVDHATRFDARGMIAMAGGGADAAPAAPVAPPRMVTDAVDAGVLPLTPPVEAMALPIGGAGRPAAANAVERQVERVGPVRLVASPVPTGEAGAGDVAPPPAPPEEPEAAPAAIARPRIRFAMLAQGAPKVAIVALADGLAVSAAVGALSEGERHRLRDTIAATLSRHGLRPRAVTLLAMPAATLSTER